MSEVFKFTELEGGVEYLSVGGECAGHFYKKENNLLFVKSSKNKEYVKSEASYNNLIKTSFKKLQILPKLTDDEKAVLRLVDQKQFKWIGRDYAFGDLFLYGSEPYANENNQSLTCDGDYASLYMFINSFKSLEIMIPYLIEDLLKENN